MIFHFSSDSLDCVIKFSNKFYGLIKVFVFHFRMSEFVFMTNIREAHKLKMFKICLRFLPPPGEA